MATKNYAEVGQSICVACGACKHECPKEAITIWRGQYAVIDADLCVGCGKCAGICPTGCIELCPREAR